MDPMTETASSIRMGPLCMPVQFVQHPRAWPLYYHAVVAKNWTKSTLGERLEFVMSEMEWDEAELARQMGARGQSTVQHWIRGRNKRMQSRFAWPLQDKHHWSARWLLDGEGEPRMPYIDAEKQKIVDRVTALPIERLKALAAAIGLL